MKRFVTYLYEYERGQKSKNIGFVRVDIRGNQLKIQIYIQNNIRGNEVGEVFALVKDDVLMGIKIGEVRMLVNQVDAKFTLEMNNIMESGFAFKDITGIGIRFRNNSYLASCWKDEDAECIAQGMFKVYQKAERLTSTEKEKLMVDKPPIETFMEEAEPMMEEPRMEGTEMEKEEIKDLATSCPLKETTTYRKIELDQIHNLPSSNWHLCNNSFLVHGFFNYGYLMLKKEIERDKETLWLGVPGFFEKPEMVMAVLFGFSEFQGVPQEVVELDINMESIPYTIEKNQEPKNGLFGCWFVKLNK